MLAAILVAGCGTTTRRIGTEQLLISDAVDDAVSQIDFSVLADRKVYLDSRYVASLRTNNFVDSNYVISSLRQQLTAAGAHIQDDREQAAVIVEPRVGALGTDGHEINYGLPKSGALTTAVTTLSSSPVPAVPELSVAQIDAQTGVAKLVVFAYDRQSKEPIWQSGLAKAESTSRNTWILGAGPFQKGTIHEGVRFAGQTIEQHPAAFARKRTAPQPSHRQGDLNYRQEFAFDSPGPSPKIDKPTSGQIAGTDNEDSIKDDAVKPAGFEENATTATDETKP